MKHHATLEKVKEVFVQERFYFDSFVDNYAFQNHKLDKNC